MKDVVITLERFRNEGEKIAAFLNADLEMYSPDAFLRAFSRYDRIVAVMASGIAVRAIAPLLRDKWSDPPVVVVSPDLVFAIPLVGGHHGANELARQLVPLGVSPVITTATERAGKAAAEVVAASTGNRVLNPDSTREVNAKVLDGEVPVYAVSGPAMVIAGPGVALLSREGQYSVGIGCRKGTSSSAVEDAIRRALELSGISPDEVTVYATTDLKAHEQGIIDGVRALSGTLLFLDRSVIGSHAPHSPSRAEKIGLAGVAEPCALATSRKKELILQKTVFGEVTVAIAR